MTVSSLDTNVMKGIGSASKAIGGFFGSIPFIKDGPVDDFLKDSGNKLTKSAKNIEKDTVKRFAAIKTPEDIH